MVCEGGISCPAYKYAAQEAPSVYTVCARDGSIDLRRDRGDGVDRGVRDARTSVAAP